MRNLTWVAAATALLLLACGGEAPPSVLLVTIDTTRVDHLSIYGYPRETTPNLSRLAGESVRAVPLEGAVRTALLFYRATILAQGGRVAEASAGGTTRA